MFLFSMGDLGMLMRLHLLFTVFVTYYTKTSWFRFNKVLSLSFLCDQYSYTNYTRIFDVYPLLAA